MDFDIANCVKNEFCLVEWVLNQIKNDWYYPQINLTIAPMGVSCQGTDYCTSQSSQMDKINDFFFYCGIMQLTFQYYKIHPVGWMFHS